MAGPMIQVHLAAAECQVCMHIWHRSRILGCSACVSIWWSKTTHTFRRMSRTSGCSACMSICWSKTTSVKKVRLAAVMWFRNDLRMHDNEALAAADREGTSLLAVGPCTPALTARLASSRCASNQIRASAVSRVRLRLAASGIPMFTSTICFALGTVVMPGTAECMRRCTALIPAITRSATTA